MQVATKPHMPGPVGILMEPQHLPALVQNTVYIL